MIMMLSMTKGKGDNEHDIDDEHAADDDDDDDDDVFDSNDEEDYILL
jgi:hypothetical protein